MLNRSARFPGTLLTASLPGNLTRIAASLLLCWLVWSSGPAFALDPGRPLGQYGLRRWTNENGLPQNSIHCLLQTRSGYICLGTQEGLVRFDGMRFQIQAPYNTGGLRSGKINAILEAPDGSLWLGTIGGGVYRLSPGGEVRPYSLGQDLNNDTVQKMVFDPAGRLIVATSARVFRLEQNQFRPIPLPAGLSGASFTDICAAPLGRIWFATHKGLWFLQDTQLQPYTGNPDLASARLTSLASGRGDALWIGTSDKGLFRLDVRGVQSRGTLAELPTSSINALHEDARGILWVGTRGQGLWRLPNGRAEHFPVGEGIADGIISAIGSDREGNLWVGTDGDGLFMLRNVKLISIGHGEGLPEDRLWSVSQSADGAVWLGTVRGVARWEPGRVRTWTSEEGLGSNEVLCCLADPDGTVWIGTDRGLYRIADGRVQPPPAEMALPGRYISALYREPGGILWVGTTEGFHRWDGQTAKHFTEQEGFPNLKARSFLAAADGSLWIGTWGDGIGRLTDGRLTMLTQKEGLPTNVAALVFRDSRGAIWVGTNGGGLALYRDGRFLVVNRRKGLFDDTVLGILEDDAGQFWMSCNRGIFRASRQELLDCAEGRRESVRCEAYNADDGMGNAECNGGRQPSSCRLADGRLCFPTIKGLVMADPLTMTTNSLPPLLALETLTVDGCTVDLATPVTIPPGSGRLEFQFTALSFTNSGRVRFRYLLEGFDPAWQESGTERRVSYTNLPPGQYTFRVTACNDDGVWNTAGVSLALRLQPYFHQTWPFRVLLMAGLAILTALAFTVRLRSLKARKRELERQVTERTVQLAEANDELARLAQTDGLTGVSNRRYLDAFLDSEWKRALRSPGELSFLLLDVDHFKAYNDNYGHQAGDDCLKDLAAAVKRAVHRDTDLVARYGGEEFAVVLPVTGHQGAMIVAWRVLEAVAILRRPHTGSNTASYVTVSIGAATITPSRGATAADLLAAADAALYQAKKNGRNRVVARTQVT